MNLKYIGYFASEHKYKMKKIYFSSFPKKERFPFWVLKNCIKGKNVLFNEILDKDKIVGIEYLINYKDTTYLMYLAVDENKRNKGYGEKILKDLIKKYNNIILSIERSNNSLNDNNERRKKFYLRNGFFETNRFTEQNGIQYEILCTNKNYKIMEKDLRNIYNQMTGSTIMKYFIEKRFNLYNINFIK